ncbi:DGQHR domain-containing protein [Mesorhizobium sp. DCY119]|uniref:DGQHR domain-containing protein n=1 Tax=Mesorhizobium sp. DCY119 TaxID=2108445 RepID=UPI000E6BB15C|nr:DGQHR domain-containing protein [Mesorhizobium sp. DCY119]RJG46200.1 DGQHR domain-containing protein [Mesorhizobium sp. DCY119]
MPGSLTLAALRGSFGTWVYYVCIVPVAEIGARVRYAEEIHPDKALSALIQRRLTGKRAKHIAEYLSNTPDRFFNSLVLATYGGSPEWLEIGNFRAPSDPSRLRLLSEQAQEGIGFLMLSGKERIFALDGQHRLAGIRQATSEDLDFGDDTLPVVLVAHRNDAAGRRRTRRLFTTLNKTAVPVQKLDIIALDEDDAMAIVARRLVENDSAFRDPRTAVISSLSMPVANKTALMTIATLYDVLKILFLHEIGKRSDRTLRFNRPPDARLDHFHELATDYFSALATAFKAVADVRTAEDPRAVTRKHRSASGGHILFRSIGLENFTRTVVAFADERELTIPQAVAKLRAMPVDISAPPYRGVIWDPARGVIVPRGKPLLRRLMFHMAGLGSDSKLLADYKEVAGTRVRLPAKIA